MAKKILMKEKTREELAELLAKTRAELRELRFEAAGARPKDSDAPRKARRMIARILTETKTRENLPSIPKP